MILVIKQQNYGKKVSDYLIALDTSKNENSEFSSFKEYSECDKNAILFCACKHREGSDIKNLDCCIFLDKVEDKKFKNICSMYWTCT